MEPQGGRGISPFRVTKRSTKLRRLSKTTRRSRVHVRTVGLNAETKKVSAPSPWGNISLDIPFYRTFWRGTCRRGACANFGSGEGIHHAAEERGHGHDGVCRGAASAELSRGSVARV